MFAVVRIRGEIGIWSQNKSAMKMLGLDKKHKCIIISKETKGQLQKIKDYCTWGEIDEKILVKMLEKRARIGNKRVSEEDLKSMGVSSFQELAKVVLEGKIKDIQINKFFRLSPPSKGYKHSIKHNYPKGELGYRGEKINELLERMI